MIFQDSSSALNPVQRVGDQVEEMLRVHQHTLSRSARRIESVRLLAAVGIPEPERRHRQFPHELSGGMRQRVMIAIAIANSPAVLVADEPTTALDVTIQAQVIEVLQSAQRATGAASILVTHDLGLVSQLADRVIVMYAGRVVEAADVFSLFARPQHPYTVGLLRSIPRLHGRVHRLTPIPGHPPSSRSVPRGCSFVDRCFLSHGRSLCHDERPRLRRVDDNDALVACHFAEELLS